ncbi:hypothetical protein SAMN05443667_1185 [Flavobacterium gillisiae]|uniref:Uncharacterized protein n=1 Tax=Flavobacterium gillisiae TaxID=150146 RepID=A0A1H4GA58_9FLAO|nr:hypothetical protein SAMN05443667_1185 [Flavobacterium gillisiae]
MTYIFKKTVFKFVCSMSKRSFLSPIKETYVSMCLNKRNRIKIIKRFCYIVSFLTIKEFRKIKISVFLKHIEA